MIDFAVVLVLFSIFVIAMGLSIWVIRGGLD